MAHMGFMKFIDLDVLTRPMKTALQIYLCTSSTFVIFVTQEISLEKITLMPLLRFTEVTPRFGRKKKKS